MISRSYILFLMLSVCFCSAQKHDSTKISKHFFEVQGGGGHFTNPPFVSSKNAALAGTYKLYRQIDLGFNYSYNFNYSNSQTGFIKRFLSVGAGINYMSYRVDHTFENYANGSRYSHFYHEFSRNSLSYNVNTINPTVFLSSNTVFPGGFFVRNRFGLSLVTYLNKQSYTYSEHITGSEYLNVNTLPYTQYYDWVNIIQEYNYDKIRYNAYYNLSFGTTYKNMIVYLSPEVLLMDNELHAAFKYQGGIIFLLK